MNEINPASYGQTPLRASRDQVKAPETPAVGGDSAEISLEKTAPAAESGAARSGKNPEVKDTEKDASSPREKNRGKNAGSTARQLRTKTCTPRNPVNLFMEEPGQPASAINLTGPARLVGKDTSYEDYCQLVHRNESRSIEALQDTDIYWHDIERLQNKVTDSGEHRPFYGDTTVVRMGPEEIEKAARIQKKIIQAVPEIFAEPLAEDGFHITIHDLSNNKENTAELQASMKHNKKQCRKMFGKLARHFAEHPDEAIINLKPSLISPDATVSMGFVPANEKDYRTVMNIRNLFDDIVDLGNVLKMHISLCYFKPFPFSDEDRGKLSAILKEMNEDLDFPVQLDLRRLAYQRFNDMNSYLDHFLVADYMPGSSPS